MKMRIEKESGTPVDKKVAKEFEEEFKVEFDKVIEEFGKSSEETRSELDKLDERLQKKYEHATVITIEFPKTKKAWNKLLDEHGAIKVCRNVETNEIVGLIPDMVNEFGF